MSVDDAKKEFLDIFGIHEGGPVRISFEEQKHWEAFSNSKYPWYVSMIDRFMSGWGGAANRKALFVFGARSLEEADIVAANARARGDQSNVMVHEGKPRIRNPTRYRFEFIDPNDGGYKRWYKAGGFGIGGQSY